MKKILVCLITIVVVMNLSAQVEGTIQWQPEIDFTYQINGEYIEILSETGYVDEPGMPQIPYCVKTFLIPVNAQPVIQVKYVNRKLQKKDVLLYPVQPPIPIGESSLSWVEPNNDIYNSSNPFPGKYAEIVSFRKGRLGAMVDAAEKNVNSDVDNYLPEYLIITNETLKEKFRILADWKTKKGIPAIIETVEEISTTYTGSDIQEKIRNYLVDVKRNYGSMFVLLGGDTNVIPARVKKSRDSDNKDWVAVDFYYTCVDNGNWNKNGNNIYYEADKIDFEDSKDWGVSFKLGRAPVETLEEAEVFVNKVIHYEKADLNHSVI